MRSVMSMRQTAERRGRGFLPRSAGLSPTTRTLDDVRARHKAECEKESQRAYERIVASLRDFSGWSDFEITDSARHFAKWTYDRCMERAGLGLVPPTPLHGIGNYVDEGVGDW